MYYEDDEEFDLVGDTSDDVQTDEVETSEEAEEEETEVVKEEKDVEEKSDETETTNETPKDDNKVKALDAERARRKAAERELKELKAKLDAEKTAKENEDRLAKERESYKKKMLEGDLVDEDVADKLLDVFGEDIIKNKIANQARAEAEDFDRALSELKQDELFMDADVYKPKIKELMSKGLTIEEAYMASVGRARFSQMKKDLEVEAEQRILNSEEKADKIDVGHSEAKSEVKRGKYTKREQEIARETGLSVEEVHKRYIKPGEVFSIEDMEKL